MDRLTFIEDENKRLRAALRNLNDRMKILEYKPPTADDMPLLKARLASLERKVKQLESMIRMKM